METIGNVFCVSALRTGRVYKQLDSTVVTMIVGAGMGIIDFCES